MFGSDNNGFGGGESLPTDGGTAGGSGAFLPVIQAAGMVISSLIDRNESKKAAQRNMWNAKALSDYEFAQNLKMWELQNQYNSPSQQMMRLGQAGLNPNLIYGASNAPGNQSGAPPQYKGRFIDQTFKTVQIPQVLSEYQNFAMRQAQINNVKAATQATKVRTANEEIRSGLLDLQGRKGEFELGQKQELAPFQVDEQRARSQTANIRIATELQRLQNLSQTEKQQILDQRYREKQLEIQDIEKEKKQAEAMYLQYKNELREMGIHESDNIMLRILIRMINESGFSPTELF